MEKVLIFACLTWASIAFNSCYAQNPEQYLPTFNIARDKEVTVNATCGGDLGGFQLLDLILTELKSHMICCNSMPLIG